MSYIMRIGTMYGRKFSTSRLTQLADNFRGTCAPCAPVVPPPVKRKLVIEDFRNLYWHDILPTSRAGKQCYASKMACICTCSIQEF